jgi:hypothetical protein
MSTTAQNCLRGLLLLSVGVCQPANAQPVAPAVDMRSMCNLPGSQYNPICNARQPTNERPVNTGEERENGANYNTSPISPIERATLPPSADSIIAWVPDALVQAAASQNLPPMWMRVCRTNTSSSGQSMFVRADNDGSFILIYPRCTYVAFSKKVSIGTTSNDQATAEYQLLGRF